jgi:hypothetical protein
VDTRIAELGRVLHVEPADPRYIETVPGQATGWWMRGGYLKKWTCLVDFLPAGLSLIAPIF